MGVSWAESGPSHDAIPAPVPKEAHGGKRQCPKVWQGGRLNCVGVGRKAAHGGLFVSGRFGGCDVGEGFTPKAAFPMVLLRLQLSKGPMKVIDSGPGHAKTDGYASLGLLGGCS